MPSQNDIRYHMAENATNFRHPSHRNNSNDEFIDETGKPSVTICVWLLITFSLFDARSSQSIKRNKFTPKNYIYVERIRYTKWKLQSSTWIVLCILYSAPVIWYAISANWRRQLEFGRASSTGTFQIMFEIRENLRPTQRIFISCCDRFGIYR